MKCKMCKGALAGAIAMGVWYLIGVAVVQFMPALLNFAPQLVFAKELAPAADAMDFGGIIIGLIQVCAMAFGFVYLAYKIHCQIEKRKK